MRASETSLQEQVEVWSEEARQRIEASEACR